MGKKININERVEIYCGAFMSGDTRTDAFKLINKNAHKWKANSVHNRASLWHNCAKVQQRLKQLREVAAERNAATIDDLIIEFEENRQAALCAETPQLSAANQATTGKAKLLGLGVDKLDLTSSDGTMTPPPTRIIREIVD